MIIWISAAAALLYTLAAFAAWRRQPPAARDRWLALVALILHAGILSQQMTVPGGMALGTSQAASLFCCQSALLLWFLCWREPLGTLGIAIYPLAAAGVLMAALLPAMPIEAPVTGWRQILHVVLALLSAGLLTLAAVQSALLAMQDQLLHRHSDNPLIHALPPLLSMEKLLFQLIAIGFLLLSATLLTGLWFLDDWMKQHLAHKTVLSISAWVIFAVLLWGRWRYGWRGRVAIRWALSGYATLILAYFGSKLILEQILGKHWG